MHAPGTVTRAPTERHKTESHTPLVPNSLMALTLDILLLAKIPLNLSSMQHCGMQH